jgi:hypothetical protein
VYLRTLADSIPTILYILIFGFKTEGSLKIRICPRKHSFLKSPFFWDIVPHLWMTGARHLETVLLSSSRVKYPNVHSARKK